MNLKVVAFILTCCCLFQCSNDLQSSKSVENQNYIEKDSSHTDNALPTRIGASKKLTKEEKAELRKKIALLKDSAGFKGLKHHWDSTRRLRHFVHNVQTNERKFFHKIDSLVSRLGHTRFETTPNRTVKKEVLGWYPSWVNNLDKHVNYNLVSTIAYFSYELDPNTGLPTNINDWKTAPLLDSIKQHGNKLLLTVTNFTASKNRLFLRNNEARKTFIDTIIPLIKNNGAHGICLDMEGVAKEETAQYTDFIKQCSKALRKADKTYQLYVACPSIDWQSSLDLINVEPYVDQFAIMGYCFYGSWSSVAGPGDPLYSGDVWNPYNLDVAVKSYLAHEVPASKIILALPYYGCTWHTENESVPAPALNYIADVPYNQIKANINGTQRYDTASRTAWISYQVDGVDRQCWYDDDSMFGEKLDYIIEQDINGLGIWALGYDIGYNELYQTIDKKLGVHSSHEEAISRLPIVTDSTQQGTSLDTASKDEDLVSIEDAVEFLEKADANQKLLLIIFILIVFFGGVGFLAAMLQPQTSALIFDRSVSTLAYCAIVLVVLLLLLNYIDAIEDFTIALIVGFALGAVVYHFVNKYIDKLRKQVP